jgi:DNA-binding transcriptional MerR regulator
MATTIEAPKLRIGQIAERSGVAPWHIRYYERVGVLPEPELMNRQRRYCEGTVNRLLIIDALRRVGLSLEEIAPVTGPDNPITNASLGIRDLAERALPQVDALIARAQAIKCWLEVDLDRTAQTAGSRTQVSQPLALTSTTPVRSVA